MKSRIARTVLTVVGGIAVLIGAVWVGQGANLIPGSMMTGDPTWFVIGLILGVGGIVVIALGLRRPGREDR